MVHRNKRSAVPLFLCTSTTSSGSPHTQAETPNTSNRGRGNVNSAPDSHLIYSHQPGHPAHPHQTPVIRGDVMLKPSPISVLFTHAIPASYATHTDQRRRITVIWRKAMLNPPRIAISATLIPRLSLVNLICVVKKSEWTRMIIVMFMKANV